MKSLNVVTNKYLQMKSIRNNIFYFTILLISFAFIYTSCEDKDSKNKSEPPVLPPLPPPPPETQWDLVWSDEFEYTGKPDPSKWGYEIGFVRNEEEQYYTNEITNAFVSNGVLTIRGIKEQYRNRMYGSTHHEEWKTKNEFAQYTSASINTKGIASWKYGKIEVRAKLPRGIGVWPAIWTLGANIDQVGWPASGEIDIMEYVGYEPHTIHVNVHYAGPSNSHRQDQGSITLNNPWEDFHIYTLEWDEFKIVISVDDTEVKSYDTFVMENTFKVEQYILLNLALGGAWGGKIDDDNLPQDYQIDYVRVYQVKEE